MDKDLFDDLIASCQEAIAHQNGLLQLKTTTLEIPDEVIERNQLFIQKFHELPEPLKLQAIEYVDDLLSMSS